MKKIVDKIVAVEDKVKKSEFSEDLAEIEVLECDRGFSLKQKRRLAFSKLKAFNRMQWLVEAKEIVSNLVIEKDLSAEESLELALYFVLAGELAPAEKLLKKAVSLSKSRTLYVSELAILYEQQGQSDKAQAIYEKIFAQICLKGKLDSTGARVIRRLVGLREFSSKDILELEKIVVKYRGDPLEAQLLFSLAKCYSKVGNTAGEIEALTAANRLNRQLYGRNESPSGSEIVAMRRIAITKLFKQARPDWMNPISTSDKRYIFILGMPRSGTTLVEQILGAHSLSGNSGESRAMGIALQRRLENKDLSPEDRALGLPLFRYKGLDSEDTDYIIEYYEKYQSILSDAEYVTDKELSNIDRVGLLANIFPNAKFLCVRRHPLDVCVSILQHDFTNSHFSNSSLSCAKEYVEYYKKTDYWASIYASRFYDLQYEEVVERFDEVVRSLIDFLGLDWEQDIANFYKRQNSVRTPSLSQVRQALNSSSVEKYRKYMPMLNEAQKYLRANN